MTLRDVKAGKTVVIEEIEEFPLKARLMSMGLIAGTRIRVLRSAPLGDPIAISVRAYNLALRLADAEKITVREISA